MSAKLWRGSICCAVLAWATSGQGYEIIRDGSEAAAVKFGPGSITMQIKLGTTPLLSDGSNYSTSVQEAMQQWNAWLGASQFSGVIAAAGDGGDRNGINEMFFSSTTYGQSFGANTLAVAISYRASTLESDGSYRRTQADVIFNIARTWDSYRGATRSATDLRRVALHELGHVLGLDHPDESGQAGSPIMNSFISSVDSLQQDDIDGAQYLYGAPAPVVRPANDDFVDAQLVTLVNHSAQVTGRSTSATKEVGEPNHAPNEIGGPSVWWKIVAPSNGSLTVATAGTKFDTMLGAYTGTAVNALTQLAANDDIVTPAEDPSPTRPRTSAVTIPVNAYLTYYFAVDGWDRESGSIILSFAHSPSGQPVAQTITFGALSDRPFNSTAIPLSATASSTLPVSYSIVSGPATIAGTNLTLTGTGTVVVRAAQVGDANYHAAPAVDRSFVVTPNFDSWNLDHFNAPERANASISGPTVDPDGDGLSNLVEYALGLNPRVANAGAAGSTARTETEWTFTYTRPAERGDVLYAVEASTDLTTWSTAGVTHTRTATGATETWRASVPVSASGNLFFRLRVTR
ncbi:MAG: matrixin family metalloprotease [Candidatus Didemnitutus sp.]|nr:matrixin family metalloprotease [Candidatus Didemnitutus sp.]